MNQTVIATAMALFLAPAPCQAASHSIVGTWAADPRQCTPVGGMVEIGGMSLHGDELACEFADVARRGEVVTWHGRCGRPEPSEPATVVATLTGGRLRLPIDGKQNGTYRRCQAEPVAARVLTKAEAWPGDRWRADIHQVRSGHDLHATLLGSTTTTGNGDSVQVTCSDEDITTGKTVVHRHHAWAQTRQDDWEGDAGDLGSFGSDGKALRWFGATPCAAGPITWKRL